MAEHDCEYIADWDTDGDGDPIFCDKPARWKLDDEWYCTEHYDMIMDGEKNQ